MMYVRIGVLLLLFAPPLAEALLPRLVGLATGTCLVGALAVYLGGRTRDRDAPADGAALQHPLEVGSALVFATLFLVLSVATRWVATHLGAAGVRVLASVVGAVDIDPFVLGLATGPPQAIALDVAASAVLLAAASNDVAKAGYALAFGDRRVGAAACIALLVLAGVTAALAFF